MENVSMDKVSKDVLLQVITGEVNVKVPQTVEVLDTQTGTIKQENGTEMQWASLTVADSEDLDLLRSIGREELVPQLKVKLADYKGEDVTLLVGQLLDTTNMELVFTEKRTPRGTQIDGVALECVFEYQSSPSLGGRNNVSPSTRLSK